MTRKGLLKVGVIGSVVTIACCFTPVLTGPLAALGLTALVATLDTALLIVLAVFFSITAFALWTKRPPEKTETETE